MKSNARHLIIEIINTQQTDPIRNICIDTESLQLMEYITKRLGRPRHNWWNQALSKFWSQVDTGIELDMKNQRHTAVIKEAASLTSS